MQAAALPSPTNLLVQLVKVQPERFSMEMVLGLFDTQLRESEHVEEHPGGQ